MALKMLVDARHREETRVAVVKGNRIEEFDFESAEHKQLKGNIYLAKVTRVEPSLQAAFVDYGGNRHGFLAFSEIHPDYYQIPQQDREALLAEEAEHAAEEAALRAEVEDDEDDHADGVDSTVEEVERPVHDEEDDENGAEASSDDEEGAGGRRGQRGGRQNKSEAAADELRRKRMALRRRYKIQDVIRRRQVLLVQVVKEERGNKGAALSTYLSLAGRYCVLMPNTSHGGGISRKINNNADRKRLKSIIADMNLPATMGCIVRTAGLQRTKTEIRRDFDYLARLWDEIREKTLKAVAPELIHDDSDLIKRAIRDIYHREIEEVVVEGEEGYRAAKDFMKLLMPSHARRVKPYADPVSLFQRYGVEDQLAAMYHPVVQLKSGGYLVINPTEALVSIDINSGRSTREHNIEQTAVSTNLEAAREIARQLRLRDMAGLVVIDFIDMEHNSNIRKVEKAMKEALKDDRARIQVGRISGFGLMEMSRQRLRTGVLEASTRACPHCEGTGLVRTASSAGLSALRLLEEEAARGRGSIITLRASQEAAFYVLNNKRREIDEIERRYGVTIAILPDGEVEGARMSVEASGPRPERTVDYMPIVEDADDDEPLDEIEDEEDEADEEEETASAAPSSRRENAEDQRNGDREGGRKRRRRRRGRRGRPEDGREGGDAGTDESGGADGPTSSEDDVDDDAVEVAVTEEMAEAEADAPQQDEAGDDAESAASRKTRRGRRGGRRRRGEGDDASAEVTEAPVAAEDAQAPVEVEVEETPAAAAPEAPAEPEKPKTRRRPRARKAEVAQPVEAADAPEATSPAPEPEEAPAAEKPARKRRTRKAAAPSAEMEAADVPAQAEAAPATVEAEAPVDAPSPVGDEPAGEAASGPGAPDDDSPARRGWWQRTFGA